MADTIGHPLTHHVTINFGLTGISAEDAVAAFRNVRNRYIKWARRPRRGSHAFEPTFAYVFENVRDQSPIEAQDSAHNVHAHWALHVPAARAHEFVQLVVEWLDQQCASPSAAAAIQCNPVWYPRGLRRYMLKGAEPQWAAHFGAEHADQGAIVGRRSGVSRNVGPSARKAFDRLRGIRRKAA
jgi:hypothetical protein